MAIPLKKNIGMVDRMIRSCIATAMAVFGILIVQGTIGMILVLLSAPVLLTAIIGFYAGHVPSGMTGGRDGIISGSGDLKKNNEIVSAGIETLWLMPRGEFDKEYGRSARRARV